MNSFTTRQLIIESYLHHGKDLDEFVGEVGIVFK